MRMLTNAIVCLALSGVVCAAPGVKGGAKDIAWQKHAGAAFKAAEAEQRLVLLDLVAVWCHWCHVMEETTYQDRGVQSLIAKHYIPVKADHDARPDLAERYRDYGWPATIVLTADGQELIKRAGYIEPGEMQAMLTRALNMRDKRPEQLQTVGSGSLEGAALTGELRERLLQRHLDSYDDQQAGLRLMQKFLDEDSVIFDLELALRGDADAEQRARASLAAAARLIDPEFGGAYQYSTHGDWAHPHYEKIAATQAAYLRVFSRAYAQLQEPAYLAAAKRVGDYLLEFWKSEEGGFYNSQDADLKQGEKAHDYFALAREQRLELGMPRIDKKRYASTNGLLIEGLVTLYAASSEKRYLAAAVEAFNWTLRSRLRDDGGFAHGASDAAGPYLADSLYMARATLAMYRVSGQTLWLKRAGLLAEYMQKTFALPTGGWVSAVANDTPVLPVPQIDQNIRAAHFLLDLAEQGEVETTKPQIEQVMRYLVNPPVVTSRLSDPGILLADRRFRKLSGDRSLAMLMNKEFRHVAF